MNKLRKILLMEEHVCPSWLYFSLNNYFRKLVHDPEKLFKNYVGEGQTAIDLGCGPGFFALGLATLVGRKGKVFAVDIQKKSFDIITEKIKNTCYDKIVMPILTEGSNIPVKDKVDFVLTFWMLHEVSAKNDLLKQIKAILKSGSLYLLVEPKIHVSEKTFLEEVALSISCGLEFIDSPKICLSRAALFRA